MTAATRSRRGAPPRLAPFTLAHFLWWVDANEITLEDGSDWHVEEFQCELTEDLYERAPRELWAVLPEGNGKTSLAAAWVVYDGDHAATPWIPIGAASRDQAKIMFDQSAGFIRRSETLSKRFRVLDGYREIRCPGGGVGVKVYPWDPNTGDGVIPFPRAYVDEPHRHPDLRLYRLWKGKLLKRRASIVAISTAGEPESEFENIRAAIREKAETRERDGCHLRAAGRSIVYHEWMVPSVEQARDLDAVKGANPLSTITVDDLVDKLASETLDFGEDWLRLTCNIPARSSDTAVPEAEWDACETQNRIPKGVPVLVGADFAWLEDSTAITPVWVKDPKFRLFGDPIVFEPPGSGVMIDAGEVKESFRELHERNPIEAVVMDPAKAQDIAQWLSGELGLLVITRSQSNSFAAEDYEHFIEGVRERWIRHTGDPTFRRHVLSAIRARLPSDKHRFDRPRTQRKHRDRRRVLIDALQAAAMVNTHIALFRPQTDPWAIVR